MQIRKKQLLGLVGLALVAAITAVACAWPTPDTSAASDSTKIKVEVVTGPPETDNPNGGGGSTGKGTPTVQFVSIQDKSTVTQRVFTVDIEYTRTDKLDVKLTNDGNIGGSDWTNKSITIPGEGPDCQISYSVSAQHCVVTFDLADSALWTQARQIGEAQSITWPYGTNYTATATATNYSSRTASDAVGFTFWAAYLKNYTNETAANGNPIVHAAIGDVAKSQIFIFDQDGRSIAGYDENGNAKPAMDLPVNAVNLDDYRFDLPMEKYAAKPGKYTVVLVAFDNADVYADTTNIISISMLENVPYGGINNPEVPDTGSRFFGGLNISNADYIVTGLIAFGMVTAFAIFLIVRRGKHQA